MLPRPPRLPGAARPSREIVATRASCCRPSPACAATRWRRRRWRWRSGSCGRAARGVPLYRLLGGRGGEIAAGVSIGLQHDAAALVDKVAAEAARGLPAHQDQDQAGPRPRARGGGARALPRPAADGGRQQRLHAGGRAALPRAGRLRPDDGRAAAGLGRHRGPRRAAAPDPHAGVPRRVDPLRRRRAPRARPGRLPDHQHQGGPRGRLRGELWPSTTCAARGVPGLVRRHARVRHRAAGERAPADAARLHAARRHLGQRALLRRGPGRPAGRGLSRRHDRRAGRPGHRPRDRLAARRAGDTTFREEWRR